MPPPVPPYVIDLSIGDQPDTAIDLETYEEQELVARKERLRRRKQARLAAQNIQATSAVAATSPTPTRNYPTPVSEPPTGGRRGVITSAGRIIGSHVAQASGSGEKTQTPTKFQGVTVHQQGQRKAPKHVISISSDEDTQGHPAKRFKAQACGATHANGAHYEIIEIDCSDDSDSDWDNYHAGFKYQPVVDPYLDTIDSAGSADDDLVDQIEHLSIKTGTLMQVSRHQRPHYERADRNIPAIIPQPPSAIRWTPEIVPNPFRSCQPGFKAKDRPFRFANMTRSVAPRGPGMMDDGLGSKRLQLISAVRESSGAIVGISQVGTSVAVASSALGGMPGIAFIADIRASNRPGGLLGWKQSRPFEVSVAPGHFKENQEIMYLDSNGDEQKKLSTLYYTVNDVKHDPLRADIFVSSSKDDSVRSWKHNALGNVVLAPGVAFDYPTGTQPFHLDHKPGTSLLAVGCLNGSTYLHFPGIGIPQRIQLRNSNLEVSSQVWAPQGGGPHTMDMLFISGQPAGMTNQQSIQGNIRAWKLRPEGPQFLYDFKATTADLSCLRLAAFAAGYNRDLAHHTVEIYDVRSSCARSVCGQALYPFHENKSKPQRASATPSTASSSKQPKRRSSRKKTTRPNSYFLSRRLQSLDIDEPLAPLPGEVIQSAFSPDGIYLACSRDDNETHVWDSRYMGGKAPPCHILQHGPSKAEAVYHDSNHGVTCMSWVTHWGSSSPPLLVTGGDDGMIRRWDMRGPSSQEGQILAELETNVGCFTLGDIFKGEMPLIAGDCHAKMYTFDYPDRFQKREN